MRRQLAHFDHPSRRFDGSMVIAPLWVSLAIADFTVKLAIAAVALVPFRIVLRRVARGV